EELARSGGEVLDAGVDRGCHEYPSPLTGSVVTMRHRARGEHKACRRAGHSPVKSWAMGDEHHEHRASSAATDGSYQHRYHHQAEWLSGGISAGEPHFVVFVTKRHSSWPGPG